MEKRKEGDVSVCINVFAENRGKVVGKKSVLK